MPILVRLSMVLMLGIVLGFGLSVGRPVQAERSVEEPVTQPTSATVPWEDARLLAEVLEHVRGEYVEEISDKQLIEAAIRGMMSNLDPHSKYLDQEQFNEVRISTSGEYSGVGIEVALDQGIVRVLSAIEDGPAARAGILTGDRILAVNDVLVDAANLDDTIDRMRGDKGTDVKLSVLRNAEAAPLEFLMQRASVQLHSVRKSLLEPGLGYVRITHFSDTTTRDVERALRELKKQNGTALRGMVLDLRNNPGGVLEAAVGVSDLFLEDGLIVSAIGRAADAQFEMSAQPGDLLEGAPLAVLVNGGSASASEIVAGALRDHRRATLIGQKTYGKGSVQTVMPLSNGQAIKLTTSRYFTPSGASIHQTGILPDHAISEEQIKAADPRAPIFGSLVDDYELRVAVDLLFAQPILRQGRLQD